MTIGDNRVIWIRIACWERKTYKCHVDGFGHSAQNCLLHGGIVSTEIARRFSKPLRSFKLSPSNCQMNLPSKVCQHYISPWGGQRYFGDHYHDIEYRSAQTGLDWGRTMRFSLTNHFLVFCRRRTYLRDGEKHSSEFWARGVLPSGAVRRSVLHARCALSSTCIISVSYTHLTLPTIYSV